MRSMVEGPETLAFSTAPLARQTKMSASLAGSAAS